MKLDIYEPVGGQVVGEACLVCPKCGRRTNRLEGWGLMLCAVCLAILDGEGEKCPTCGGTDRDGGTVATSGPDEFGNYETDDCEDEWHGEQK